MTDDLVKRLRSSLSILAQEEAADRIEALEVENARLRDALSWYRGNVSWCNNFGREGTEARDRLANDLGEIARAALQDKEKQDD